MMEKFFDVGSVVSVEEFEGQMQTYFRPYMTTPGVFYWQALFDFVKYNERQLLYLGTERNLYLFLDFFLELLDNSECHSASLMNRLLGLYCDLVKHPDKLLTHYYYTNSRLSGEDLSKRILGSVLRHLEHTDDFDFCPEVDFGRVHAVMNGGSIVLMQVLVKNGFSYLPPENFMKFASPERLLTIIETFCYADAAMFDIYLENRGYVENVTPRILFDMCLRICKGKFQRLALLFMALEALLYRRLDPVFAHNYAMCFRLFYRTIPEPFLTLKEMKKFFTIIFNSQDIGNVVQMFIEMLKKMYPESDRQYEPRKLLHLCRARIRSDAIENRKTVPEFLSPLKIPTCVKEFILANTQKPWIRSIFATPGNNYLKFCLPKCGVPLKDCSLLQAPSIGR